MTSIILMSNKKPKKLIEIEPSKSEIADLTTTMVESLVVNLPLAYEPIKYLFAVGAAFSARSIVKMGSEVKNFIASDKAKRESEHAEPYRKLFETLKFLHNSETLDDNFVEALRNLHILTFAQDVTSEEVAEIFILLETARKLSGPEISILLATYKIKRSLYPSEKMREIEAASGHTFNPSFASSWARMVAKACGYSLAEYVESRQGHLEDLRLIVPRNHNEFALDGRGNDFIPNQGSRLTDFGEKLAEYIVRGEEILME